MALAPRHGREGTGPAGGSTQHLCGMCVCVCVLGEFRAGPLSYTRVELRRARPYRAVVDTPERLAHAHWNVPSAKALLYAAYEGGAAGTGT